MKRIYLACPYTHEDAAVRQLRAERATRAAALLMQFGDWVFSPITYGHAVAQYMNNHNSGLYWIKHMLPYMSICDHFYVLKEEGYNNSVGIWDFELVEANRLNLAGPIMISLETLEEHERMSNGTLED